MDHAAGMGVGHRLGDGREDRQEPGQVVGRSRAGREQIGQRLPFHQLHAEERPLVGERPQLVDRHHARMLQLPADLRLLDEPADQVAVVAEVFAEHLDRDVATEVGIAAFQDGTHAAASDLAVDPVAKRRVIPVPFVGRMIGEGSSPTAVSRSRTRGTRPIVAPIVSSTEPGLGGRSSVWSFEPRSGLGGSLSRPCCSRQRGQWPPRAWAGSGAPQLGHWFSGMVVTSRGFCRVS